MANRHQFVGVDFLLETSEGVANSTDIVAAGYSTVTEGYQATETKKVFLQTIERPSGLPTVPQLEVAHTHQTHSFEHKRVLGAQHEGEVTLSCYWHGGHVDPSTVSGRPQAPPWLQMIASAGGKLYGQGASDKGGAVDAIAAAPTSATQFAVKAAGSQEVIDGHMFVVNGPGTATTSEWVRPSDAATATVTSCLIPLSQTPAEDDPVWYAAQVHYDEREENNAPSFCILLHQSADASAVILRGCRVTSFTITDTVGELGRVDMTVQFLNYSIQGVDSGEAQWSGYNGIEDTIDGTSTVKASADHFDAIWAAPEVCVNAEFATVDSGSRQNPADVAGMTFEWTSGWTKFMANTATEGAAAMYLTAKPDCTFTSNTLYINNFRNEMDSFTTTASPFIYSRGTGQGKMLCIHVAQPIKKADPGLENELDGNQSSQVVYGSGDYSGDADAFSAGLPAQARTIVAIA